MSLRITIDIFSGRPNPVIEISGKGAREILERVKPSERLGRGAMGPPEHVLGYRGLIIEQVGAISRGLPKVFRVAAGSIYGPRLFHRIADPTFEDDFSSARGPATRFREVRGFAAILKKEIERLHHIIEHYEHRHHRWPERERCRCAPLYEPAWWNDAGQKQYNNNCYNYATNYRTDTFAQPGRANGAMYTSLSCPSVRAGAIADDLIACAGREQQVSQGRSSCGACHLAQCGFPLVSQRTQWLLVA